MLKSLSIIVVLLLNINLAHAVAIKYDSEDNSYSEVNIGEGGIFIWNSPVYGFIFLTGGVGGSSFKITDKKIKGGGVEVSITELVTLADATYGNLGEPPISLTSQIETGSGEFTVSFENFVEIDDISAVFTADLVSNGTDNPLNLSLFGQGDQLSTPKLGMLDYVTKWESTDSILLSNGDIFSMGDFFLNSLGAPDAFEFSLSPSLSEFNASFTIGQQYLFVDDLALAPSGNNLLQTLEGSVTKTIQSVPEPSSLILALVGLTGICFRKLALQNLI